MNKTELKSWPLHAGRTEWNTRRNVGKSWCQTGIFVSQRGICTILTGPKQTVISTAVGGREYKMVVEGPLTPRGVSVRCSKLLKMLTKESANELQT